MKVSIAIIGSRTFTNYKSLVDAVNSLITDEKYEVAKIVSGGAEGADKLGKKYAYDHSYEYLEFPADWEKFGKAAGYIRNKQIVESSDVILAFWDGKSKGTKHSIDIAHSMDKPVYVMYF